MSEREFHISDTPIESGVSFLEASAGTGKTYTISKLVVRLIAEKELPVSSILVMTFTEAATRELKDRVRKAIHETLLGLHRPDSDDALAKHYRETVKDTSGIVRRLREALATFDEASIFTIHGFCHRVLNEFAFEGNRLFEATLIKEPTPLWREAIEDYWRKSFYTDDGFAAPVLEHLGQTPESILSSILTLNRHPELDVLPPADDRRYEESLSSLRHSWRQLQDCFNQEKDRISEVLRHNSVFKKTLRDKISEVRRTIQGGFPSIPYAPWLQVAHLLQREQLTHQLMQRHKDTPLDTSFFDLCEAWNGCLADFGHQHLFFCAKQVRRSLGQTKTSENLLTFDDMLPAILHTLEATTGSRLQARIQGAYQAALIDEFQDTDPQQTELFRRLFVSPDHFLFLIGDPKQAIYKFRGADIFSYLEARTLAKRRYTLSKNWRSDPKLIDAVNDLFSFSPSPFLFDEIEFLPSSAALAGGNLKVEGTPLSHPLKLCFLESTSDKPISNTEARETIRTAVSKEILKLLDGGHQLDKRAVRPSDVAILTRSNREAHDMRSELSDLGIPSVVFSDQTVFQTEEASVFQVLLNVLLEPGRLDWIRGLYITPWFNWTAKQVTDENWLEIQEQYFALQQRWKEEGILVALDEWIRWSGIKPKLLSQAGGERSLTNLLHLVELTAKAESDMQLSPLPLIQWFAESVIDPDKERDDFITRLESDDQAVQIVTVHKSKGLQYPIVFVPFAWNDVLGRFSDSWIYHKSGHSGRLVYDNRAEPDEQDVLQFHKETLSDAVRLLYVALTRAEASCYLFWGDLKGQDQSAIGHLLGLGSLSGKPRHSTPSQALEALKSNPPNGLEIFNVEALAEQSIFEYQRYEGMGHLSCRPTQRPPARGFQISSFSSLATGFQEAIDDQVVEDEEGDIHETSEDDSLSIFSLPKGTVSGNLIHDVLEQSDFTSLASLQHAIQLAGHASLIQDHWLPTLETHLTQLLQTPLPHPDGNIILNEIGTQQCQKECEFHFPTRSTSTKELLSYLRSVANKEFAQALPALGTWSDYHLNGFLRGFIDLLFEWKDKYYILDWKSNWLGNQPQDYDSAAMNHAMAHHAYYLQYYLYTLAAVRYLQLRIPGFDYEKHFGGIYYIFVRGIDPHHPGCGVYFDRPKQSAIQQLDALFQEI